MVELPTLPYAASALNRVLSAQTMRLHHGRHHAKYVAAVNQMTARTEVQDSPLEEIISWARDHRAGGLLANAGQAWNHGFLWNSMTPHSGEPDGALAVAIGRSFGSVSALRDAFLKAGAAHFGSGWVWLATDGVRLEVCTTHDAGTLATGAELPLLVCDLWEHAYYLDHLNDRSGYLTGWWDMIANWDFAEAQFRAALGGGLRWTYADGPYPQPLGTRQDFEGAIAHVNKALVDPPEPDSVEDRRLDTVVRRVADFHAAQGDAAPETDRKRIAKLERDLQTFGRRWPGRSRSSLAHWAPVLGGDLSAPTEH